MISVTVGAIMILFGLVGCSTASKEPIRDPQPEIKIGRELSQCRKWFGEASEAIMVSDTEFLCRIDVKDEVGLTVIFNKWKIEATKARKSGATKSEVKSINEEFEKSARQLTAGKCPKNLTASIMPFNGKIACTSATYLKSVIYLLPPDSVGEGL